MKSNSIPILYYHSVADHKDINDWSFLSINIKLFVAQIKLLKFLGYKSCTWDELFNHINGTKQLNKKTIMFHFDDGFLDNWTVVFPIMKKYGFKFSILITPEFVEKSDKIRSFTSKTFDVEKSKWWGYLNEGEIKEMSSSGLVDFQCHGYSHTWLESSEELLDFYDGNKFTPHLKWNLNVSKKPKWLSEYENMKLPIGYPIFKYKKSLELNRAFIPNIDFINECINCNKENGYQKELLTDIYNKFKKNKNLGCYESEKESFNRMHKELISTRNYIFELTKKKADYIVFPGGGMSNNVYQILKEHNFKLASKGKKLNLHNTNIFQISRLSAFVDFKSGNLINFITNIPIIYLQVLRGQGKFFLNKLIKR